MRSLFVAALAFFLLAVVGGSRAPSVRAEPGQADPEKHFFKGYYLEHAEKRPQEALVLYLQYLRASPDGAYARPAAKLAYQILSRGGSPRMLDEFLKSYGALLPEDLAPPPRAASGAKPAEVPLGGRSEDAPASGPDARMLARFEGLAAQGRVAEEVKWAERLLQSAERMWGTGDFMKTSRQVTRAYRFIAISRVAQMIQRKAAETDALKKNLRVSEGFGGGPEAADLRILIDENEKAMRDARSEVGLYEQIARLYPDAVAKPGRFGFLGLTLGILDPNDPRFLGWPKAALLWMKDQSMRRNAKEDSVQDALETGKKIQQIQDLIQEMRLDEARAKCRALWIELSR